MDRTDEPRMEPQDDDKLHAGELIEILEVLGFQTFVIDEEGIHEITGNDPATGNGSVQQTKHVQEESTGLPEPSDDTGRA